jgi:hypothetical protein
MWISGIHSLIEITQGKAFNRLPGDQLADGRLTHRSQVRGNTI